MEAIAAAAAVSSIGFDGHPNSGADGVADEPVVVGDAAAAAGIVPPPFVDYDSFDVVARTFASPPYTLDAAAPSWAVTVVGRPARPVGVVAVVADPQHYRQGQRRRRLSNSVKIIRF